MEDYLTMNAKERERMRVLSKVKEGEMKLKEASELLSPGYRQCKRVWRQFLLEGDKGLIHRNRGKQSNHRKVFKEEALEIYQKRYYNLGFGPTLASEELLEGYGYKVDHETLRRWLIKEGLWQKKRKRPKHRKWRPRKEHFGELVQMDGSIHCWFEEDEKRYCLMVMVDDATGITLAMLFEEETTEGAMIVLWEWIKRYGIPKALDTDRKNIYITDREPTTEELLEAKTPRTAFGKACEKIGVVIIPAYSPQAKGRIERKNSVFQDRFVKGLRLQEIKSIEGANKLLENEFLDKINKKFCSPPGSKVDFHREVPEGMDLKEVFCFEEHRKVNNDWTIRYHNRIFQIRKENKNLPPSKKEVLVRKFLCGSIHIYYRGEELLFDEISIEWLRQNQCEDKKTEQKPERNKYIPSIDHPWRRFVFGREKSLAVLRTANYNNERLITNDQGKEDISKE